jgi:two-component system phosphate regulon sensor histidine kinase PhoR
MLKKLKEESKKFGLPLWQLPDFLIIAMAFVNVVVMIITYCWAEKIMDDPREAVLLVAAESALILIIGNVMTESSKKVINIYKLKEEFVDLISHQVRTPLTNIKWNLELLEKNKNKPKEKYISRLAESVEKMSDLVNDFVYLSRLERSKKEMDLKEVDFEEMIKESIKDNKLYAGTKNVSIFFEKNDNEDFCIKADNKKLGVVLDNIINNAIKYSYEGGKVEIYLKKEEDRAIVEIKDNGCGIKKKGKNRIFEKFYRSPEAVKISTEGTGVGLFVAKSLADEMQGSIDFQSEEEKGTTFFVEFPLC